MENAEKVVKIRSRLNSSNEFSVKSIDKDDPRILTIKIERSKGKGSQEIINEISDAEYKALKKDKTFNTLLENGDLQVLRENSEDEKDESNAFSMEDAEAFAATELEAYKTGEGASLLQSSLDEAKDALEVDFAGRLEEALDNQKTDLDSGFLTSLNKHKVDSDAAAKTAKDEAVLKVKNGLIDRHNKEFESGKLKKW